MNHAELRYIWFPYFAPFGLFINASAFCMVDHWRRWVYLAVALGLLAYLVGLVRSWRQLMRQYR